jgi:UDP-N-acetyl-D-glucosamine dehydrogenase
VWAIKETPKVVGGLTPACLEVAQARYCACLYKLVTVSSPELAELTKLLENTFRAVNIALVNEMVLICERLGVDVWEVVEAASTKPFGFYRFNPGPGVGGHCIPLDPHYLAWKMRRLNYETRFINLASEINEQMPTYVVDKVVAALNADRKAVNGSRVLVIGVAYKRDIEDMRESPALSVISVLASLGAEVVYHDPFVPQLEEDGHRLTSVALTDDELRRADAVVIVTDHSTIDYQRLVNHSAVIVDSRNATAGTKAGKARIVSLSARTDPPDEPVLTRAPRVAS